MELIIALPRWTVLFLWIFWFIHYWIISYLIKSHASTIQLSKSFWDVATLALLGLVLFTLLLTILVMTIYNPNPMYLAVPWLGGLGALLAILGFIGMYWSRLHMGKLWLPETGLKREHRVIDDGLYGIVRHPIYTSVLVFYMGSIVVFPVWWNWMAFLGAVIGYMHKALEEEIFLSAHLPGYSEYQRRVRYRLIPGIW